MKITFAISILSVLTLSVAGACSSGLPAVGDGGASQAATDGEGGTEGGGGAGASPSDGATGGDGGTAGQDSTVSARGDASSPDGDAATSANGDVVSPEDSDAGDAGACSSGTWEVIADGGADAYGTLCSSAYLGCGDASAGTSVYSDYFETNPYAGISGTWQVDNSEAQSGKQSIHPPIEGDSGAADMSTSCAGTSHGALTFYYNGLLPAADQHLNFYVDDALYATYGNTYNIDFDAVTWNQVDIVVPSGVHTYRWDATTGAAGQPPYWVDSINCLNTPVVANTTGVFDFEDGFVPPEFGGDFHIDNSEAHTGTFAAHPPILPAGGTATAYFSCGCRSHSKLSFYYNGFLPASDQQLNFYVDGALYKTYGNTYNIDFDAVTWTQVAIDVQPGPHQYRWDVTTVTTSGPPPYWIDTIQCQ